MQDRAGYESDRFRLVLYDRGTKQIKELLPNFDRWVDEEAWSPDSRLIYFTAGDKGEEPLYRIGISGRLLVEIRTTDLTVSTADLHPIARRQILVASRMTVDISPARCPVQIRPLHPADPQQIEALNATAGDQ